VTASEEIAAAKAELRQLHFDAPRANALRAKIAELKQQITQPWTAKKGPQKR
jgi:hypothetical protein